MEAPQQQNTPPAKDDGSRIFGVSVRGWLAVILVTTVCALSLLQLDVNEKIYSLAIAAVAFYFGHAVGKTSTK